MNENFRKAFNVGYERLVSWSDLLDAINVFPVRDADTGQNLRVSLAPLKSTPVGQLADSCENICRNLLFSATGNSGNIASCFFIPLVKLNSLDNFAKAVENGRDQAYKSVLEPKSGTMLTFFDKFVESITRNPINKHKKSVSIILDDLEKAVLLTSSLLPCLQKSNVVDAGALGMFIYMEGFLKSLVNQTDKFRLISEIFKGKLLISSDNFIEDEGGFCINTLIQLKNQASDLANDQVNAQGNNQINAQENNQENNQVENKHPYNQLFATPAESLIVTPEKSFLKIHLHTKDKDNIRSHIEQMGDVVKWNEEKIQQVEIKKPTLKEEASIHIMTDAAGSVTRKDAQNFGITLLDSYIVTTYNNELLSGAEKNKSCDNTTSSGACYSQSIPETLFAGQKLYEIMKNDIKVSTAQASLSERYQCYQTALERYDKVLYLCTGSIYTGNYATVCSWKKENDPDNRLKVIDPDNRLKVIDSGSASGRLGLAVLAIIKYSLENHSLEDIIDFAQSAIDKCEEYLFLDKLKYLVRGGRLSKTSGF
ncbi:MAG: hypothetical protein B6I31_05185, partial [Desulfobacteraceae bacterium 4572_19]